MGKLRGGSVERIVGLGVRGYMGVERWVFWIKKVCRGVAWGNYHNKKINRHVSAEKKKRN